MNQLESLLFGREKIKLDLGCGPRKISPDFIGIDNSKMPGVDLRLNLENAILPFENNSVDYIFASHVLEHIQNYVPLVEELWRIMKPGGKLEVVVPHYKHECAFTDPTHVRFFTRKSFHLFDSRKVPFRETGWYMSHARFLVNEVVEKEREICYSLSAQKKQVLLVGPSTSIHMRRWIDYISGKSHFVTLASRLKKGIAEIQLGEGGLNRQEQIENMPRLLERVLASRNPDVVHVNFATRYGHLLSVVPKSTRRILSVWGEDVLQEAVSDKNSKDRLISGLNNSDFVTTTSDHMAEVLEKQYGVDRRRIWTIPWGYNSDIFTELNMCLL